MSIAKKVSDSFRQYEILAQNIDEYFIKVVGELQEEGLTVAYEFLGLHPMKWKIIINGKEEIFSENDLPIHKSMGYGEAIDRWVVEKFTKLT
ncbi:hypothetical protein OIN60_20680 [Paenibacillus sp. P96]|uniref:Uncharacterized protein n=1 Tax=Paenibacillus zeirhizosphaerae TaxID=2987519 RepID=A0ABT9FWM8_9BACL|nr:hypothetical protein [Paenibacillus sp. P96]MDP4099139.1 hypothetical protein [Paenibacillus sp. P96]